MSHPDEGTIHAWLDGALSAEEAAQLEAHVAACDECQAVVAEARGLIAAASRILGALDNVPGGVVPKAAGVSPLIERLRAAPAKPVKRWSMQVWAVAATVVMLVGAGVLMKNSNRAPDSIQASDTLALQPRVVVAESVPATVATAPAAPTHADKPANGPVGVRREAAAAAAGDANALDAVSKVKDSRANAVAGAPAVAPAPIAGPMRAKVASQAAGGAGSSSGVVRDAAAPTSAAQRQLSEQAGKDAGDPAKRDEGVASAVAAVPAEKKALGEVRAADRSQDVAAQGGRAMLKAAAPAPASASAPTPSCARITLGEWRSTSQSAAHGVTAVTARPGPTANAATTVTLDYADGPRTEIGAWLLQPDTARLTVRDARDQTSLRLVVSRSTGSGIGTLTSPSDKAIASATARTAPEGCVVPKPE